MACMGPQYSKQQADKAYEEILELLKVKYNVLNSDDNDRLSWRDSRMEKRRALRRIIHDLFELDSFESF